MFVRKILYVVIMAVMSSYQSPLRYCEQNCGSSEIFEVLEEPVSTKPVILLVQKFPISHQESPNDKIPVYKSNNIKRNSRDLSTSSREGRFLFKFGAKQIQKLFLWSSFLANTAATGSLSATNSFNLFGKTINSALSLAYGNSGFIPSVIPPVPVPVPVPVFPQVQSPTFPVLPIISPVTTKLKSEAAPVVLPITTNTQPANPPVSARITPGSEQTGANNQRQLLQEYLEMEKRNQKLLSEYNNFLKQQQKITINRNEQWKEFIKAHNLMVHQFNDKTYFNVQRANEI